ncbi:MAG: DUF389 domain-containing protein [Clostridium sp.]
MNKITLWIKSAFSLESDKASNEEIYKTIINGSNVKGTNLIILMLAIFIASIGLNMNSTAVIIGAMLISPLMGGIMAIGYGMATNNISLLKRAVGNLLVQVSICLLTSTIYFAISPITIAYSELLARTKPTIWDVFIAIFGGIAGIIGVTRKEKTNIIPGVAIATALMPPLCTAGYGIAIGSLNYFLGALYLFFINSFFICVSTYIVIRIMRIPPIEFIDEVKEKRVKKYIFFGALITIIPSIFLGYQIVKESVDDSNIQRFISNELKFENTYVISSVKNGSELNIAILGETLSDDNIKYLENKLSDYNLNSLKLKVTQSEMNDNFAMDDIQKLIEYEINQNKNNNIILTSQEEIENLKAELVKYKTQLLEYQKYDINSKAVLDELKVFYPEITSLSIGSQTIHNEELQNEERYLSVIIKSDKEISSEEKAKIETWIKTKTSIDKVILYINLQ